MGTKLKRQFSNLSDDNNMMEQIGELIGLIAMCDDTDERHCYYTHVLDLLEILGVVERERSRRIRRCFEGASPYEKMLNEFNHKMDKPERNYKP